uniref:Maspardin n=1 Tax=Acanthochromis polyacanthus TaxID=80966 RepID=A0A3Q1FV91_9TELE
MDEIKVSPDYNWFRSTVPLKRIIVDDDDSKVWSLYDAGPKSIRCPIIFLPPVSGTAEVFFQQVLALTGWGYRVISKLLEHRCQCPWSSAFCIAMD